MCRSSSDGDQKLPALKQGDKLTPQDIIYSSGLRLALLLRSIFTGMILVSLDRLIVSTAIPQITNQFNSAGDIGWSGTAYLFGVWKAVHRLQR
ncbi:hypothetical protein BDV28DRAFT_145260 [Aspergillus coremiiformis]|uniref:Major facilitator superfamily (MFS) profile domain-containing protein n=1 Tax=Aspergillus coremiiformis TaxID=138285 RepID=A0A5N6ZFC6_9EURO|nr:hypothetical protein BDV28DRAFT_145260 [Aspergillus coremiiformis]